MLKRTYVLSGLLIVVMIITPGFRHAGVDKIMMDMEGQSLHKGKRADMHASMFYRAYDGRLVTKYHKPVDHVVIANNKGELAIFSEKDNTVYREQSIEYSTENNLIYFFLSGMIQDLGLKLMGFQLIDTEFIDGLVKTNWFPPQTLYHMFSRIELVHENQLPIYAGYYDVNKKLIKKIFYTDYSFFPEIVLPMTVTEFNYLPGNDSIVNRIRFSNVLMNHRASSSWLNFTIPDNAKLID